jgi:membrane fusion protein (multidrug efflux system)
MNFMDFRWRVAAVVGLVIGAVLIGRWLLFGESKVPQEADRAIPVVTAAAKVGPVIETYGAIGTAAANEAVVITSKVTGIVRSIEFTDGEMVPAGKVLIELEDR